MQPTTPKPEVRPLPASTSPLSAPDATRSMIISMFLGAGAMATTLALIERYTLIAAIAIGTGVIGFGIAATFITPKLLQHAQRQPLK